MLESAKSSILPNGNFREFFLWRGEFCVFKTGIPGGPDEERALIKAVETCSTSSYTSLLSTSSGKCATMIAR